MTSLLLRRGPGVVGALVELGVVGLAVLADVAVRRLTLDDLDRAVAHARDLDQLQQALHLDWERAAQRGLASADWLEPVASWFYVWGYLPVLAGALVVLFARFPWDYARLRNALVAGGILGLPVYALYPLAPPRLAGLGFTDTVDASLVAGAARPAGIANELAAMPSFHVGYLVVVSVVVWRLTGSPWVRAWCLLHPVAMCWVVLATANHWVLDLPAGVLLGVVGLGVAGWIEGRSPAARAEGLWGATVVAPTVVRERRAEGGGHG